MVCSNYHHPVDQSFCDSDDKPAAEQECTAGPCPSVYNRQRIYEQPYGYPQDPGHHPGHSSWNVPSADNQWRTGPWGAVCSRYASKSSNVQKDSIVSQFVLYNYHHHLLYAYVLCSLYMHHVLSRRITYTWKGTTFTLEIPDVFISQHRTHIW